MKTVCAWCSAIIHDGPPEPVSHGICRSCARKRSRELRINSLRRIGHNVFPTSNHEEWFKNFSIGFNEGSAAIDALLAQRFSGVEFGEEGRELLKTAFGPRERGWNAAVRAAWGK